MTDADSATRQRLIAVLKRAVADGVTPGAVAEISRRGSPTVTASAGHLASFDTHGNPIPEVVREPVTADTVYDLASVSKLFTSITLLTLADQGVVDLDASVGEWLPAYRTPEKSAVTLAHLLSHTSGLPATNPSTLRRTVHRETPDGPRWVTPVRDEMLDEILALPLVHPAGTTKVYSCVGYISAMALAVAATGTPWPNLVQRHILAPLKLYRTTFWPDAARTAPTEFQPHLGRGLVHGVVHDETAHALGGPGGNAGLFAPSADVTALGAALRDGLPTLVSPKTFARLWDDELPGILGTRAERVEAEIGYGQSLGLRIGQTSWMGDAAEAARGHTGFTGTSLLVDREAGLVVTLLTNRVHQGRDRTDATALRHTVHTLAYSGE